jgi:hypothetical protein
MSTICLFMSSSAYRALFDLITVVWCASTSALSPIIVFGDRVKRTGCRRCCRKFCHTLIHGRFIVSNNVFAFEWSNIILVFFQIYRRTSIASSCCACIESISVVRRPHYVLKILQPILFCYIRLYTRKTRQSQIWRRPEMFWSIGRYWSRYGASCWYWCSL